MSIFTNFKSVASFGRSLGIGIWTVILTKVQETDSFHNLDGSKKNKEYEWADATPQLAVQFYSEAEKAWFTHRFNGGGFKLMDELTDKQIASGKFKKAGRYALDIKTGKRIPDPEKTQKALNMLNDMFTALRMEEGAGVDELAAIIANKTTLDITIEAVTDYGDEEQLRIKKFRKTSVSGPGSYE